MSESKIEEVITALWAICAILCAASGFTVWAWVFGIKATMDVTCCLYYAWKELMAQLPAILAAAEAKRGLAEKPEGNSK